MRKLALNALVLVLVTGLSLVAADLALYALQPRPPAPFLLPGMLQPDPELEHVLVPGFQARFDDALARGEVRISSRGQRDSEPTPPRDGVEEWLLLGDSFAFGQRLDQAETIDAFVEKRSEGRVVAWNGGVPGYGPPNVLGALRRADWFAGRRVFYLFFANDLFPGEQETGAETVVDGWPVKTRRPDGAPYTRAELAELVARARASAAPTPFRDALRLAHLRAALARALRRGAAASDLPSDASVAAAVRTTMAMRDLAVARGQEFALVAIPALEEVASGRQDAHTRAYLDALRREGVALVEPFSALAPADYIAGDGHLSPSGAEKLARAMLDSAT